MDLENRSKSMKRFKGSLLLGLILSVVFLSGCGGDPVGYVSGKVILATDDDPEGLYVTFINTGTGIAGTALVDADGNYRLTYKGDEAIPVGVFTISVKAHDAEMSDEEFGKYMSLPLHKKMEVRKQRLSKGDLVPKKYHDPSTSGLSYEITQGCQTYDIDVSE